MPMASNPQASSLDDSGAAAQAAASAAFVAQAAVSAASVPYAPSAAGLALRLDKQLRSLAAGEACARAALGRLARRLLEGSMHHSLGFARVGDYTRERLGISSSLFYELARVAKALSRLPLVAQAFEDGALGWSKLRIVASVAEPESEHELLALARSLTSDELKSFIKHTREMARAPAAADSQAAAPAGPEGPGCGDEDEDLVDGEPAASFTLACPRHVRHLWRSTIALARAAAGSELPVWEAAELIAAEGLSTAGWHWREQTPAAREERAASAFPAAVAPRAGQRRSSTQTGRTLEAVPAELTFSRRLALRRQAVLSGRSVVERSRGRNGAAEAARDRGEPQAGPVKVGGVVAAILAQIDEAACDIDDLDAHALDQRMRRIISAMQRIDAELARPLRMLIDLRLHRDLGYGAAASYVRDVLGLSARKAYGLLALERKASAGASALAAAYRSGELAWYRCLLLLPIICEENAGAWIERAGAVTARRLSDEVEWALQAADESARDAAGSRPAMPPPLGAWLDPAALFGARPSSRGAAGNRSEADEARLQIRGRGGVGAAGEPSGCGATTGVSIRLRGPLGVIGLLRAAIEAFRPQGQAAWCGLERLLIHAATEWRRAPRHRDPVFERDGWRCAVPVCTSRRNLHDHHVVFRSRGGRNGRDNRLAVCACHHLRGIHLGVVRVEGKAPDELVWQIGVPEGGGAPLLTLDGPTYIRAEAPSAAA